MGNRIYHQHSSRAVLLSPHYAKHVSHMTTEDLHGKAEIAEELAVRDMEIDRLRAELAAETTRADLNDRQCEAYKKQLENDRVAFAEVLDNERAKEIHSCHDNCMRDGCVNRRLRAELAAIKRQEPIGKIERFGQRPDGRKWHGACIKDDGSVDLPAGTPLYALPVAPVADKDAERLRELLIACRGSVKSDLNYYEKRARAYGNLGPEGKAHHEISEQEASRLFKLLEAIDAAMAKGE